MVPRCLESMSDAVLHARLGAARSVEIVLDSLVFSRVQDADVRRSVAAYAAFAGVLGIASVAVVAAALAFYPHFAGEARFAELVMIDNCAQSVAIYDTKGWLGNIPKSMRSRPGPCQEAKEAGWRVHSTSFVPDPPDEWWKMAINVEDGKHGSLASINCVDVAALGAVVFNSLRGRFDRGASTITMQLSRSLRGLAPSQTESLRGKLRRKLIELRDATVLCQRLGGANSPRLRRWVARNMPCAQGSKGSGLGGSIYGLQDCARILFGKSVGELTLAENAILVASIRRHVVFAPVNDEPGQSLSRTRWDEIRMRARSALDRTFGEDDLPALAAKVQIERMEMPVPALTPNLKAVLPADPAERIAVAANPEKRVAYFTRGEVTQAFGEVLDVYGEVPNNLIGIEFTLDAADNLEFKRNVEEVLECEEGERRDLLRLDLPPSSSSTSPTADVTVSLVNSAGNVVFHYSSGYDRVWSGPNAKRDRNGRYQPESEDRTIGSVAKMVAAPLLGTRFRTSHSFCNQWLDGLTNPNGSVGYRSCASRRAWVSVPETFANSFNLPIAWALKGVARSDITAAVTAAGLGLPQATVPPRTALAFGMVTGSPRAQHRLVAALNRGARHEAPRAVLPTLIKSLIFREVDGGVKTVEFDTVRNRSQIDLSAWFEKPNVGAFVAEVLAAPTRSGGTLDGLDNIVRRAGGSHLIAKSGTTVTPDGRIRDQLVVGSFVDGSGASGEQMTFQLLIGAADPRTPLADRTGVSRHGKLQLIETLLRTR